eukprot:CAMPEP_0184718062 /NCGR_PEP_ID=MMETSP0314-20130426/7358_1 /TAXON_ID=38298 /ORGANISM="Rhodella maculata, Strain CCMP 736" /LENGTH=72 /DNA_ID=CAMNT_0027181739 /DNA_START=141 /DNA_END=359 /DNA_ORIENTATION=-
MILEFRAASELPCLATASSSSSRAGLSHRGQLPAEMTGVTPSGLRARAGWAAIFWVRRSMVECMGWKVGEVG